MEQILAELNKTQDVEGCCIVAEDGIIIASDTNTELDEELVGALISSIIRSVKVAIEKLQQGEIISFMLEAEKNNLFFSKCKYGFVVVITNAEANLGLVRVELKNAVRKLESISLS